VQLQNENPKWDVSPPQGVFMDSSVNPSSNSSNSPTPEQARTGEQIGTLPEIPTSNEVVSAGITASRHQPIPPPSEPMQYRAIGLFRGRYKPSDEQLTQGTLVAIDGTELDAVLLGRIISLVRNHLDLEQEHLWVVYPRTGQKQDNLHLQIVGVWEPEKLSQELPANVSPKLEEKPLEGEELEASSPPIHSAAEIEDGYFSIRGEVVYQSASDGQLVVKIKQAARKESEKPKYFKLKLQGALGTKAVGQFWDLQAKREGDNLVVQQGEAIAVLPSKPKPARKPYPGKFTGGRRTIDTPRPVRKQSGSSTPVPPPLPKKTTPKPIKRHKPPQG